jgi:predicted nucleotidyltransferase
MSITEKLVAMLPKDYKPLFICKHGSHLYGLNTPESDVDYKGVYLPSEDDMLTNTAVHHITTSTGDDFSKNTAEDIDIEWISIQKYLQLLSKAEMIAVDILFAVTNKDSVILSTPQWDYLVSFYKELSSVDFKPYIGYIRKQVSKYGVKGTRVGVYKELLDQAKNFNKYQLRPIHRTGEGVSQRINIRLEAYRDQLIENEFCKIEDDFYVVLGKKYQFTAPVSEYITSITKSYESYGSRAKLAEINQGVDWKAVSHAIRASYQLEMLVDNGLIKFPFTGAKKQTLLDIKQGKRDWKTDVEPLLVNALDYTTTISDSIVNTPKPKNLSKLLILKMYG